MQTLLGTLARGGTVVTANNRLARGLALAFNRTQQAAGRRSWATPAVVPWGDWLAGLWRQSVVVGGEAGRRDLLTEVQSRALWGEVVRTTGGDTLPGQCDAAAALAERAWHLCQDWRIAPDLLDTAADSGDSRVFAAWAAGYRQHCTRSGWVDRRDSVGLLATDLRAGRLHLTGPLLLAGFDQPAPLQVELLAALQAAGVGAEFAPAPAGGGATALQVTCHDQRHELECAARWARWQREQDPLATIAVVVPDLGRRAAEVRREFLDVFAPDWRLRPELPTSVNLSYGESLDGSGLGRLALIIARALGGELDYREAIEWLNSPYAAATADDAPALARLVLRLRDRIGRRVALRSLLPASGNAAAPVWVRQLDALLAFAATLPPRQGAAGWAAAFAHALQLAGWPGGRPLASDEFQAAAAVQELLGDLRACDTVCGPMSIARALTLLGRLAQERLFQPAGDPAAVQVLGVLEALGQRFDRLWICGVTAETWPPPAQPEPLVGLALQRRLGLPGSSPAAVRERAERELRWLLGGAGTAVASWPRLRDDELQLPSPLLAGVACTGETSLPQWTGTRATEALFTARAGEVLAHDPPPPVGARTRWRGGASLLERQARCPARAFLEFRLGARELTVPSVGIDAARHGAITHAALARLFVRIPGQEELLALGPQEELTLLDELIDTALREHLPSGDPLVRALAQLEGGRLRRLLAGLLAAERSRPPFRVLGTETTPLLRGLPAAVTALGLALRADRIDELADGRRLVIDYKTSRELPSNAATCGPRPRAPQLPLYVTATGASGMAFVHLGSGPVQWAGVGDGDWGIAGMVAPTRWTHREAADWSALRASWWTALERIAAEFLAGSFVVDRWQLQDAGGQWALALRTDALDDEDGEEGAE